MKIIYPLFFIALLSTCVMPTTNNNDDDNKTKIDSLALAHKRYILPDKPISYGDISKSEIEFMKKAELGKVLFFTKINGSACSDCHSPKHGFTAGQQQSCGRGCEGVPPSRRPVAKENLDTPPVKSPSSIGVFGSKMLLWTGLAGSPKDPLNGLFHPSIIQVELATVAHDMRLSADSVRMHHPSIFEQFKDVYVGVDESRLCESEDLAECLAAFQMRLIPNNSQFQKWLKGEKAMSEKAKQGLIAFDTKCANCHNDGSHNANKGRAAVTDKPEDKGKFRTMRLATNVTSHITWGHGGTFRTLEDCISGHQNIDSVSTDEIDDIIEFLYTTVDQDLKNMVPQ